MLSTMLDYANEKYEAIRQRRADEMREGKKLISKIECGNEKQLYCVGDVVDGNGLGFYTGTIIDTYVNNGYMCYVVEYRLPKCRKTYHITLRQKDIVLV